MELNPLAALSPLDGRYAAKTEALRQYLPEYGLIRYRVLIEIRWLQHLAAEPAITELAPFTDPVNKALNRIVDNFDLAAAERIKTLEKETNHDVKAVEYFLREELKCIEGLGTHVLAFLHFASTSEDINNLSYALMLRDARDQVLEARMRTLTDELRDQAHRYATLPLLARTHGQAATPTTLGKELANVVFRLDRQTTQFANVTPFGKFNGAVGNYNAHAIAYPDADWPDIGQRFVRSLGLEVMPYTTQIEPHDWIAEYCHTLVRFNTIVIDLCRDLWSYVSLGYFRSRIVENEVGSSTMPHKVNPIDLENAEGNLGVANALLEHLAAKLPQSRWQRDLTDSTVLRNLAVALGHSFLAFESCRRGLGKLEADPERISQDLDQTWEVLAEAVQTVMRRYGVTDAYEQLKALTRGQRITETLLHDFIASLDLPETDRQRLLELRPGDYIGLATSLAKSI